MKIKTEKLREYLEQKNISHREFAKILGVEHSTLSKILSGVRNMGYQVAKKFIYALGAYEATKFIDWEGMAIEQPRI